jgi:hypothetical protein
MYELEEVDENRAKLFAKEIGAIMKYTSAKNASGIDVRKFGYNYRKCLKILDKL